MKKTMNDNERLFEETEIMEENDRSPIDEDSKKPVPRTGKVVNAKHVRLRRFPSLTAEVVGLLENGKTAEILEELPDFYKVRSKEGIEGYIASNFFKGV